MGRQRVDKLVVERGLVPTREKARRLILAGEVLVDDTPVDKCGTLVNEGSTLRLRHPPKPYVGRGGEKLAGALAALAFDVSGLHVLDVGASTGGFTDCLLQHGAAEVTALDVGRGQLHWKLYSDERVHVIEDVNARHIQPGDFDEPFALVVVDVSFISLTKVLPALVSILEPKGHILMLVKPQFELSPEEVERGGVIRDSKKHDKAVASVKAKAGELELSVLTVTPSPITGAAGNQEFFLLVQSNEN
jgi:23S rRNA (cytidine1920-2'-O)/16S rRNA (cytidine1409-2'-O)-methyltransferase